MKDRPPLAPSDSPDPEIPALTGPDSPEVAAPAAEHWLRRGRPPGRGAQRAAEILRAGLYVGCVLIRLLDETRDEFARFQATAGARLLKRKGTAEHTEMMELLCAFWEGQLVQRLQRARDHCGFALGRSRFAPPHCSLGLNININTGYAAAAGPTAQHPCGVIHLAPDYLMDHATIVDLAPEVRTEVEAHLLSDMLHETTHLFGVGRAFDMVRQIPRLCVVDTTNEAYFFSNLEIAAFAVKHAAWAVHVKEPGEVENVARHVSSYGTPWYYYFRMYRCPVYGARHPEARRAGRKHAYLYREFHRAFTPIWESSLRDARAEVARLW